MEYQRAVQIAVSTLLLASVGLGGCASDVSSSASPTPRIANRSHSGISETPDPRTAATGINPLENPDGIKAGLGPVPLTQKDIALEEIERVRTKGRGPKTGYLRSEFGSTWTDNNQVAFGGDGCYTRDNILLRDLRDPQRRDRCVVVSGTLLDPYTGQLLPFSKTDASAIQIDHVIPLSLAWQMGAAAWPKEQRTDFANDPLNLLAVEGRANLQKSDSGPASWLPPNKTIRCAYATRIAQVATKYDLALPSPDKTMMRQQCVP
jgi:hypothetical protein